MLFDNFCQAVAEKYGNPRVKWASGKLRPGQRVRIVIKDEKYGDRIVDATATGRRKKGKNIIRYCDLAKRIWMLPMNDEDIQTEW